MDDTRMSSFMPTIKCSMCARQIEISMMGEHICEPIPSLPSTSDEAFDNFGNDVHLEQRAAPAKEMLKPGRLPPPNLDTSAANRPYIRPQDQLTPVSATSDSSPRTPGDALKPRYGHRQIPSEVPQAPPSPEILSSNDSAFPPFPVKSAMPPPLLKGSSFFSREDYAAADPSFAPKSPGLQSTVRMIMRMNSIAPGPFDLRNTAARPSTRDGSARTPPLTMERGQEAIINRMHAKTPSLAGSNHSRSSTASSTRGFGSMRGVPRLESSNSYGGFGPPPSRDGQQRQSIERSHTFPQDKPREGTAEITPLRRPSASTINERRPRTGEETGTGVMSNRNDRSRSPEKRTFLPTSGQNRGESASQMTGTGSGYTNQVDDRRATPINNEHGSAFQAPRRAPQPYETLSRSAAGQTHHEGFCSTNSSLTADFGHDRSSHTSSLSQSSNTSGVSSMSSVSSLSSPRSEDGSNRRSPSTSSAKIDALMMDLEASVLSGLQSSPQKRNVSTYAPIMMQEPAIREQTVGQYQPAYDMMSPESPMDPAIQGGRLSPLPPRQPLTIPSRPVPSRMPPSNSHIRPLTPNTNGRPRSPAPAHPIARSASPSPSINAARPGPKRSATSKGTCKGCNEEIFGKSVSSADGRLSGKYHKACFVCKTCSSPFPTADFYVYKDAPYCERHYHQLNNSMCRSCDRGIEGQYLETQRGTKHHPNCLTCQDCRVVLRNDYFEIAGRVYCERDAVRRSRQRNFLGPGGQTSKLERRTTRLMSTMI